MPSSFDVNVSCEDNYYPTQEDWLEYEEFLDALEEGYAEEEANLELQEVEPAPH